MGRWRLLLVLAASKVCAGLPHGNSFAEMMIDTRGHILAVDSRNATESPPGSLSQGSERVGLMRQQGHEVGHGWSSLSKQEKRTWAHRHGNVYATHRLLARTFSYSNVFVSTVPNSVKNSVLVYTISTFLVLGCLISMCQCVVQLRNGAPATVTEDGDGGSGAIGENARENIEHAFHVSPVALDEDIYGMGICALIRDTQRFALGTECKALRSSRLMMSLMTVAACMGLQVFLLVQLKTLVTSESTKTAQETYNKYEVVMYGNDRSKMTVNDGQDRGAPANFNMTNFNKMDDATKDAICQVPLSQPSFFIALLLCWTLVCFSELRHSFAIFSQLVVNTPTVASMSDSLKETDDKTDEAVIVVGLTLPIKIIALVFIIIPRCLVSVILLWLGSRWLVGTFGFSDVLQNAVALEFILLLKNILFETVTPHHNKKETANTLIQPISDEVNPSMSVMLGSFLWGVFAVIFVLLYIVEFQQVLPDYQWDIHDACVGYLSEVEALTP